LQNGFEKENIKIKYNIDTDLEIEDALYCGLIVNELVTNSFKYAFVGQNRGLIEICLKKQFGHYLLSVSDNGDGYSDMEKSDALGNTLIDSLVQQQLDGEIKRISEEGVKVVISWEMKTNKKS
jgi:two-component sensor histidine kinase